VFCHITLCVASQLVFIVVRVYFISGSVRKLSDTPSYIASSARVTLNGEMLRIC
jgi:hypothetical protein